MFTIKLLTIGDGQPFSFRRRRAANAIILYCCYYIIIIIIMIYEAFDFWPARRILLSIRLGGKEKTKNPARFEWYKNIRGGHVHWLKSENAPTTTIVRYSNNTSRNKPNAGRVCFVHTEDRIILI